MRSVELNQKYWDGLHSFPPKCYTCWGLETMACLGCSGNQSGEHDNYKPTIAPCWNCAGERQNLCWTCGANWPNFKENVKNGKVA